MAYLEELLPEFRKGARIRRKDWREGKYIKLKGLYARDEFGDSYFLEPNEVTADDWELYKDPDPNWDYIIKNKCLCWFWDDSEKYAKEYGFLGFLNYVQPSNNTDRFEELSGKIWKTCRPVRRDEITFYEDKEDE